MNFTQEQITHFLRHYLIWAFTMTFAGHYLHKLFLEKFNIDLKHYIELIVIGIIGVSTVPVLIKILKKRD